MQILATASSSSKGMRHGYIVDVKEVARAVRSAVDRVARRAGASKGARVGMGGVSLEEVRSSAEISLTQSGGIVTAKDIERVIDEGEKRAVSRLTNRAIIHVIPWNSASTAPRSKDARPACRQPTRRRQCSSPCSRSTTTT